MNNALWKNISSKSCTCNPFGITPQFILFPIHIVKTNFAPPSVTSAAFCRWRKSTFEGLALQAQLENALIHMATLRLSESFVKWTQWVEYHQAKKIIVHNHILRMKNLLASRAFHQWKQVSVAKKKLRCVMNSVVVKVRSSTLEWVFGAWRDWIQMKHEDQ